MQYISDKDPVMAKLVQHFGHLEQGHISNVYISLVIHIISQMLSNKIADIIVGRFIEACGEITPEHVQRLSVEDIRKCGISYKKAESIIDLTNKTLCGEYDFSQLNKMSDDEVISYLMKIKGVGQWTAEMIAEFTLGRLNIFSYLDVALQNGIKKAHGYKTLSKQRFERIRKKYSPYCSVASLYYYALNDEDNKNC